MQPTTVTWYTIMYLLFERQKHLVYNNQTAIPWQPRVYYYYTSSISNNTNSGNLVVRSER